MSKHNEELHAVPSLLELAEQLENKAAEEKYGSKRRTKKKTEPYSKQGRASSQKTRTKTIRRLNRRMKINTATTMRSKAHTGSRIRPPKNPHLLARMLSRQTACLLVLHPLEERQKPLSFLPRLRLRRTRSPRPHAPLKSSLLEFGSFSPAPASCTIGCYGIWGGVSCTYSLRVPDSASTEPRPT